jgi:acetyl-CoA acetyltransferase
MIQTAENVAKKIGTTKEECDAVTLKRYQQYMDSMANDRAFQKRYMFPVEIKVGKKETKLVEVDEGITPTTAEGLAKLAPVEPGGVLSFGAQTHPADGNQSQENIQANIEINQPKTIEERMSVARKWL